MRVIDKSNYRRFKLFHRIIGKYYDPEKDKMLKKHYWIFGIKNFTLGERIKTSTLLPSASVGEAGRVILRTWGDLDEYLYATGVKVDDSIPYTSSFVAFNKEGTDLDNYFDFENNQVANKIFDLLFKILTMNLQAIYNEDIGEVIEWIDFVDDEGNICSREEYKKKEKDYYTEEKSSESQKMEQ